MDYTSFTYIVEEIVLIWGTLAFMRFFLQRGGMLMTEPFAKVAMKLTQWIVKPARRLVKPVAGWDAAIALAVFVVCLVARYLVMFVGVALNPGWFRPSMILLELSYAVLLTSKCVAYALLFIMAYRWMTRDQQVALNPGLSAIHHIYDIVMRPFKGGSSTSTKIMRVGVFLLLVLWVLVMADSARYYMDMNMG